MQDVFISRVELSSYRNLDHLSQEWSPGINIIVGANGTGKTNILESFSLLSPGRGLKSAKYEDIHQYEAKIGWSSSVDLQSKLGVAEIISAYSNGSRKITYNGSKIPPSELTNLLNVIWITPQMDGIFLGSSTNRRKFLDRLVYNFNPKHVQYLNKYDYFLKERNKILSENNWRENENWLDNIENQMVDQALLTQEARLNTIAYMQRAINDLSINFPKANLSLSPIFEGECEKSNYLQQLLNSRVKDSYIGRTSIGVHKTDFIVEYQDKKTLAKNCSTGEQKALLICLVIASIEAVMNGTGSKPILLLDELFVHLDPARKKSLSDYILSTKMQTFITTTDMAGLEFLQPKAKTLYLN